jgi:hypothetical protein
MDGTGCPQSLTQNKAVNAEDVQRQGGAAAPDIKELIGQCTGKIQTLKERCTVLVDRVKEDIVKSKNRQLPAAKTVASLPKSVKAGCGATDRMVRRPSTLKEPNASALRTLSKHRLFPPFHQQYPLSPGLRNISIS